MDNMKQKYTLNIADLQISVISDAPAEDVTKIGGILDRKMREIYLKSRCPKTEAALLCALECVAERIGLTERTAELEDKCVKYGVVLEGLKDRNAELTAELERMRNENSVLRSLLTQNGGAAPVAPQPIPPPSSSPVWLTPRTRPSPPHPWSKSLWTSPLKSPVAALA